VSTKEISDYYESTKNSDVRSDLKFSVDLIGDDRVAIDCGCGAGADIKFLRENGFTIYAFDIEDESIALCRNRFTGDDKVFLYQADFGSYIYPSASLVVVDASLFFCRQSEFTEVWGRISNSIAATNGIFCGSFLGPNDTMAGPNYNGEAFWPDVLVFTEENLRNEFEGYEILKWTEHNISGKTAQGVPHNWHIYSVVAKKI
jgi:hypothetical protein